MAYQRSGTDIVYYVFGFFVGGVVSAMTIASLPEQSSELTVFISMLGPVLGLAIGYGLAFVSRNEDIKAQKQVFQEAVQKRIPVQIVGKPCRDCGAASVFATDAQICPGCHAVVCKKCVPQLPCPKCVDQIPIAEVVKGRN